MDKINVKFNLSDENKKFLKQGLEKYNFSKNNYFNPEIYKKDRKYFGFYAYKNDDIIGGAYGWIEYENWVWLDLLYVDDHCRGFDVGTKLMTSVEKFAKENGCIGIRTTTWDFQARGFYEKMGFVVFGQLENFPIGATDHHLKKVIEYSG
ncbi:MAG: GNAT family N-acetyltransferase [Oscillospiraceae bacterium]|nr:GNAT family N-acetyltransferase [Oscillospiraceae bacterium]